MPRGDLSTGPPPSSRGRFEAPPLGSPLWISLAVGVSSRIRQAEMTASRQSRVATSVVAGFVFLAAVAAHGRATVPLPSKAPDLHPRANRCKQPWQVL